MNNKENNLIDKSINNILWDINSDKKNIIKKSAILKYINEIEENMENKEISRKYIISKIKSAITKHYKHDNYDVEVTSKKLYKKLYKENDNNNPEKVANNLIYKHDKKNFKSNKIETNDFINFGSEEKIECMPYVNSYIWCDTIGRKIMDDLTYKSNSYANKLHESETNILFKPFFNQYEKFISSGIREIDYAKTSKDNIIIFQLDIEKFYKNINMDNLLKVYERKVNKLIVEKKLTEFEKKVHKHELNILKEWAKKNVGLPIGLESSKILAELYAQELDEYFLNTNPKRYSRYVDDILLVYNYRNSEKIIDYVGDDCKKIEVTVKEKEEMSNTFKEEMTNTYKFNENKTKVYIINETVPKQIVNLFKKQMWANSSDFFKYPDMYEFNENDFFNTKDSKKFDQIEIDVNLHEVKSIISIVYYKCINYKMYSYSSEINDDMKLKYSVLEEYVDNLKSISEILTEKDMIELMDYWSKMNYIDKIMDKSVKEKIFNIEQYYPLIKDEKYYDNEEIIDIDKKIEKITEIEHTTKINENYDNKCCEKQILKITKMCKTKYNSIEIINKINKINSLGKLEITDDNIIYNFSDKVKVSKRLREKEKLQISLLSEKITSESQIKKLLLKNEEKKVIKDKKKSMRYIQNNIKGTDLLLLPESSILYEDIYSYCQIAKKNDVIIIGGLVHREIQGKVCNLLITIIPFDIDEKGIERDAYIHLRPKNFMSHDEKKLIKGIVREDTEDKHRKFDVYEANNRKYPQFIINDKIKIQSFNCFELCDIKSRVEIKHDTSLVTLHEWNKDIDTFEKLSRSLTNDFKVVVAQVNYADYGDIGIFMPKKNIYKELIKSKGGKYSNLITEDVDFGCLFKARNCSTYAERNNYKPDTPTRTIR